MTIYFLRHEERPMEDSTFLTELTKNGKDRAASSLKEALIKLKINTVYCSPFIRCLQTINPFIKESGLKVNIENCIQEVFWDPKFQDKPNAKLSDEQKQQYSVSNKYIPLLSSNTLSYPESETSVRLRVNKFSEYLKNKYSDSCTNILVCSHMSPVNFLINEFSENLDRGLMEQYDMGKISYVEGDNILFIN